jgi:hypothetical protein
LGVYWAFETGGGTDECGWTIATLVDLEPSDRNVMAAVKGVLLSRSSAATCIPRVGVGLIED